MEHQLNRYEKSREIFERATKVIPSGIYGHQGPAEGCFIPVDAFPFYAERAKGSYFWDVDGNRFIDYMCAYGPNILGYNDEEIDEAARKQAGVRQEIEKTGGKMQLHDGAFFRYGGIRGASDRHRGLCRLGFFCQKRKRCNLSCGYDGEGVYEKKENCVF